MIFEIIGTRDGTGKRVKAKVEAPTLEQAIQCLAKRGVSVTAEAPRAAPPAAGPIAQEVAAKSCAASPAASATVNPAKAPGSEPLANSGPAKPRQRLAVALLVGAIAMGVLWRFSLQAGEGSRASGGNDAAAWTPGAPQPTAAEVQRQRTADASLVAFNQLLDIYRELAGQFGQYNTELAAGIDRRYSAVPLSDVDIELRVWVADVMAAAKTLVAAENERQTMLAQLDTGSGGKTVDAALRGAEVGSQVAANQGRSAKDQAGVGLIFGAAGAVLTQLDIQVKKENINKLYDNRLRDNSKALKAACEDRQQDLLARLQARYGWVDKQ